MTKSVQKSDRRRKKRLAWHVSESLLCFNMVFEIDSFGTPGQSEEVASHPDTAQIPERNVALLRELGSEVLEGYWKRCFKKEE